MEEDLGGVELGVGDCDGQEGKLLREDLVSASKVVCECVCQIFQDAPTTTSRLKEEVPVMLHYREVHRWCCFDVGVG